MDMEKFAAFIAERRRELGLTQQELAKKLNVTDKAVSRWENGHGFPDINTLEPLSEALGISVVELMKSEMIAEGAISHETADEALSDTIEMAGVQKKRSRAMITLAITLTAVAVVVLAVLGWQIWTYNHPIIEARVPLTVGSFTMTPAVQKNYEKKLNQWAETEGGWVSLGQVLGINYYSLPIVEVTERSVFGMSKTWELRVAQFQLSVEKYYSQVAMHLDEVPYVFLTHIDVVDGKTRITGVGYYTEYGVTKPFYDIWTLDFALENFSNTEDSLFELIWERFPELKEACDKKMTTAEWKEWQGIPQTDSASDGRSEVIRKYSQD